MRLTDGKRLETASVFHVAGPRGVDLTHSVIAMLQTEKYSS